MKILFIAKYYFPRIGGVEKVALNLNKELIARGHKVTIVAEKHDEGLSDIEVVEGVKVLRFTYPKIKFLGLFYIWYWLFKHKTLIQRNDIVHCHDVFVWYLPFRFLYLRKPVYLTIHGWETVYPIPFKHWFLKRISAGLAWGVVSVGRFIEKYYGVRGDLETYGTTSPPKINIRKNKNSIVYVGRMAKDVGLPGFLKALPQIKGYKVEFCGNGPYIDEAKKFGKAYGFVPDTMPFLAKSEFCFASGYTTITEALINKCKTIVYYDTPIKRDVFTMTPWREWIKITHNTKQVLDALKGKWSKEKIEEAYRWALGQNWRKLADQYEEVWNKKVI